VYPRQGQVLALTGITQVFILDGQPTGLYTADGCLQVALGQLELRPHGGSLGHQVGSEASQPDHLCQCVQGREGGMAVATRLLQEGQGAVAQQRHEGLKRQRLVDQRQALHQVPFSRIQVVPLAQQVTQGEMVEEAAE